ncbi:hypothetical protein KP509_10G014600 [Ceratopteris richardii]|nr:hypothetical protein KP509_10G014600 [Ceratopteris richardii]
MHLPKESLACLNASPSASAATDGKRNGSVWWGPDAATGTWAPSTSAETMTNVISSPSSVLNASAHKPASAFWYREDVHL